MSSADWPQAHVRSRSWPRDARADHAEPGGGACALLINIHSESPVHGSDSQLFRRALCFAASSSMLRHPWISISSLFKFFVKLCKLLFILVNRKEHFLHSSADTLLLFILVNRKENLLNSCESKGKLT